MASHFPGKSSITVREALTEAQRTRDRIDLVEKACRFICGKLGNRDHRSIRGSMIKCYGRLFHESRLDNGRPILEMRPCGKKAVVFYDCTMLTHVVNGVNQPGTTHTQPVGFCIECSKGKSDPENWGFRPGSLYRVVQLFSDVQSVSLRKEPPVEPPKGDRLAQYTKDRLIKMMSQKNYNDFTPEKWMEVFQDALNEFVVKDVMEK